MSTDCGRDVPVPPDKLHAALRESQERLAWLDEDRRSPTLFPPPEPLVPGAGGVSSLPNLCGSPPAESQATQASLKSGSALRLQERLDWWFPPKQQRKLGTILAIIEAVPDPAIRGFRRCGFPHTLKAASYWLMKSSKPTRGKRKVAGGVQDPIRPLLRHLWKMQRANLVFWHTLPGRFRPSSGSGRPVGVGWPSDRQAWGARRGCKCGRRYYLWKSIVARQMAKPAGGGNGHLRTVTLRRGPR